MHSQRNIFSFLLLVLITWILISEMWHLLEKISLAILTIVSIRFLLRHQLRTRSTTVLWDAILGFFFVVVLFSGLLVDQLKARRVVLSEFTIYYVLVEEHLFEESDLHLKKWRLGKTETLESGFYKHRIGEVRIVESANGMAYELVD
ncbi:MAG: hypothetical protein AAFV95_02150 [Bacteroidota bacterium]